MIDENACAKIAPSLKGSFFPTKKNDKAPNESKRSKFGRLLADVTNEIMVESDEKYAMKSQIDEAHDIANEWLGEERGKGINFASCVQLHQ
jgi:hypothetical protein